MTDASLTDPLSFELLSLSLQAPVDVVCVHPRSVTVCSETRMADRADLMKMACKPPGRITKLVFTLFFGEKGEKIHKWTIYSFNRLMCGIIFIIKCTKILFLWYFCLWFLLSVRKTLAFSRLYYIVLDCLLNWCVLYWTAQ